MAFTIPEESFELTVMFFGLTNSLAMFYRKSRKFETESKKGHNELVKEILRKMEENN